ncbi:hypothetical protein YPPY101_1154, partial [Yersinia pestis PY-101]|jgi:hypothetical protein
MTAF